MIQTVYNLLPAWGQNLMTTFRGWQLRHLRYTNLTWERLEFFLESQFWSAGQFREYQTLRLRRLLYHATEHSPHYRSWYSDLRLDPGLIKDLDDLRALPILTKEDLRLNNDRIISTHIGRARMWVSYTSGTTGTPLTAYFTHENMQERIALMERLYHWYSPDRRRKRASFTGKLIVDPRRSKPPFHRTNMALRQQLYSSHHLTEANLPHYARELEEFGPGQIDGIASPIFTVADYLVRSGRAGRTKPDVLIPTSETLWPFIRERMEQGFLAKVANQYGSQEGAPIAYECPSGGFHTCPESGIFEILRPDGTPCPLGETGRLVVTSFFSDGMPLIRYDIGDMASWAAGQCPCGRRMPLLQAVQGRADDMFFTRERGVVPRLDSAFKSMPSTIKATQIAQLAIDRFEVRIVPDLDAFKSEQGEMLREHLYDYLGRAVRIEIKLVSVISRTASGKMPAMINECGDPEVKNAIIQGWNLANSGTRTGIFGNE
jgi:phenylacetate-CoA ligase